MVSLYPTGLSSIPADEMGVGKTLQTISFLAHLKRCRDISGLHVVVAKSALQNWAGKFTSWTPDFSIVALTRTKDERVEIVLAFSDWPIDSYSTTLFTLCRPSLLLSRDCCSYQNISTSRPFFLYHNPCLTYSSLRKHLLPSSLLPVYSVELRRSTRCVL